MSKFHSGWYLVYTRPKHEKKVHNCLADKKVTSFLPTKKVLRTWGDRRKFVDEPLFPSYVFIYVRDMHDYYCGIDATGALYYVRTGKEISRVSDTIVDSIKLATSHTSEIEVSDFYFKPGHRVVISKGALTGLTCEVVKYNNNRKLLIRVELLQRNMLLSMPEEYLLPEEHVNVQAVAI
jgi:transcriptional antiterminator RfaH